MSTLYLGPASPLVDWLQDQGETLTHTEDPITVEAAEGHDCLVSYGYRHIIAPEVLAMFPNRAVNLHISMLPWNRGADPNLWAWAEGTQHGVTLHCLDEGIDTGDIIAQWPVEMFPYTDTFRTSYARLHEQMQALFRQYWPAIKAGSSYRRRQPQCGSYHRSRDKVDIERLLTNGWDTPVSALDSYAAETQASNQCNDKYREDIAAMGQA